MKGDIREDLDEGIQATSPHSNISPHDIEPILPLRLESATKLEGKDFVNAWFDCVKCHYTLWQSGERPTTPCLTSLAFDSSAGRSNIFVDWDSATATHGESDRRAGSPAFLALDMLRKAAVPRLYCHELEALVWILPWVSLQYENGKRKARVLQGWENSDYRDIRNVKSGFLCALSEVNIMDQFGNEWAIVHGLLAWLWMEQIRRAEADWKGSQSRNPTNAMAELERVPSFIRRSAPNAEAAWKEKEPKEVYGEFRKYLVSSALPK